MRRAITIGSILVGLGLVTWLAIGGHDKKLPSPTRILQSSHTSPAIQNQMGTPAALYIPKLGLRALIRQVGLNAQGNMAAPKHLADVAWYKAGAMPGNPGNAVLAGHYGKPHQTAFWNLNQLSVGDRLEVTDEAKTKAVFKIDAIQRVTPDLTTREKVFGQTNERHLNLITCDGVWDKATKSYDQRLIVYSTRIQ